MVVEAAAARGLAIEGVSSDNDLVDEMNLLIVPVVVGQGARLFPDTGPDIALDWSSRELPRDNVRVYRRPGARSTPRARMTEAAAWPTWIPVATAGGPPARRRSCEYDGLHAVSPTSSIA